MKRKRKWLVAIAAMLLLSLCFAGCGKTPGEALPENVGQTPDEGQSGADAPIGTGETAGGEEETAAWYYDYFAGDLGFVVLIGLNDQPDDFPSDAQMAAFSLYKLADYDYETGNTKEEYNEIARKYFGREIENFDNGMTETMENGRIRATGWSFNSSPLMVLKSIERSDNGGYTAEFYCLNVSDGDWQGVENEFAQAKEQLLRGDTSSFDGTVIDLIRMVFEKKQDEAGETYLFYHDLQTLETGLDHIKPYAG